MLLGLQRLLDVFQYFFNDKWQENRVTLIDYIDDEIKFLVGWFETALIRYTFSYKMYSWVVLFSGGQVVVGCTNGDRLSNLVAKSKIGSQMRPNRSQLRALP